MSRHNRQRLADVLAAADAITDHLSRGDLTDGLVFDAVRVRLIEIGEAVKAIDAELLAQEPAIPWVDKLTTRATIAKPTTDEGPCPRARRQMRMTT